MFKRFVKACFEVEFNSGLYYMVDKNTHNFYIDFLTIQKNNGLRMYCCSSSKIHIEAFNTGQKI